MLKTVKKGCEEKWGGAVQKEGTRRTAAACHAAAAAAAGAELTVARVARSRPERDGGPTE